MNSDTINNDQLAMKEEIRITEDLVEENTYFYGEAYLTICDTRFRFTNSLAKQLKLKEGSEVSFTLFKKGNNLYMKILNFEVDGLKKFKLSHHKEGRLEFRSAGLRNIVNRMMNMNRRSVMHFYRYGRNCDKNTFRYVKESPSTFFANNHPHEIKILNT